MVGEALGLFDGRFEDRADPRPAVDPTFDSFGLRPYQRDAAAAVMGEFRDKRSTLIVMATGLGKTQTFGAIAAVWPGRVLVLAHREELLDQARARLRQMTGEPVGLEQAGYWATGERIVVASVQTLVREQRRARFAKAPFGLIVVDEAHHTPAKSYRSILEAFPEARVLGVTATPDRGDGTALQDIFETCAYRRDIETGIEDGYLTPVLVRQVLLEQVDLSRVKTTAGDLNLGQLDEEMVKANKAVAQKCLELCGDRLTIVFSTKVETAHDMAAAFNDPKVQEAAGIAPRGRVAAAVDGKTPSEDRAALFSAFSRGEFQFLINVGIATEGTDLPRVSCVAVARPTKSRALYTQMAGRGLRVLPGIVEGVSAADERKRLVASSAKPDCLLLDFAGNAGRHALVSPLDVLGGRLPDEEEQKRVEKIVREKAMGAKEAQALAREQIAAERRRRAEAQAAYEARVRARIVAADPFHRSGVNEPGEALRANVIAPSPDQRRMLSERFRVPDADIPATRQAAQELIGKLIKRQKARLASYRQMKTLARYGVNAERMYSGTASRVIDALAANGWRALPLEQVNSIINAGRAPGEEG